MSARETKDTKQYLKIMKTFFFVIFSIDLAICSVQSQTLLTETTWGGAGSDAAEGVSSAADGSSYVVGITDSFTTDQFGNPSPKIFVVKFAPDGSLSWQRIWNGTTIRGLGRPDVAVSADGSVYVTGITADNQNDAVLLKFDANGTLLWERAWGGAASDEGLAVATASDGSVYIAGTAESFGSSTGLLPRGYRRLGALLRSSRARSPMSLALRRLLLQGPLRPVEARRSTEASRRHS